MYLMRMGDPGSETPVVRLEDGSHLDARPVTQDFDGAFFARDGIRRLQAAIGDGALPPIDVAGLRVGAPIARPQAVLCIGQNYAAHAAESGDRPPEQPVLFLKHPNTVVGPYDDVQIPPGAQRVDWEVELGVVIGKRASYLASPDEALAFVAGFTISNDLSERAYQTEQSGGQWSKGKCCPTFNPLGPWLRPRVEVPDPQSLFLRSWVNGEPRQDSTTRDMIFSVAEIIHHLSQFVVLEPGDLLNTGTPQGVALSGRYDYLKAGDVVELEVETLGRQRQRLRPVLVEDQIR